MVLLQYKCVHICVHVCVCVCGGGGGVGSAWVVL